MSNEIAPLSRALADAATDKRMAVLRRIAQGASISQAAREEAISYKAAWQAIDILSNLTGVVLVEKTVGGSGGGGARLTDQGRSLIKLADALDRARQQVLAQMQGDLPRSAGSLSLRTSMRNQLPCRVVRVERSAGVGPMIRVGLKTAGQHELWSQVTRESAELLGLAPGTEVLALAKATAVQVGAEGAPSDTGNRLKGRVERISRGAEQDEVTLALDGGGRWVGFAPHSPSRRKGSVVVAHFSENALVLALPA